MSHKQILSTAVDAGKQLGGARNPARTPPTAAPPVIHRLAIQAGSGTVIIPGAAADQQTVHVGVGAEDGLAHLHSWSVPLLPQSS